MSVVPGMSVSLFAIIVLFLVSQASSSTCDFLFDLLVNLLQWRWIVLVQKDSDDSVVLNCLHNRGLSITLLTTEIDWQKAQAPSVYQFVPLLMMRPSKEQITILMESCHIRSLLFQPASTIHQKAQNILMATPKEDGIFILEVPGFEFPVNRWNPGSGFESNSSFVWGGCERPRHFRVLMEKHFPFFVPASQSEAPRGSDLELLKSLAAALQFTFELVRPPDGAWGGKNGSRWNGMIGMLVRNEADAALSGMAISHERHTAVRFSFPYAFDRVTFVTAKPGDRPKTWAILWPYTWQMWIALGATIILVSLLLTILQNQSLFNSKRLHLQDAVLNGYKAVLGQASWSSREPRCRVLLSFWWASCLTLVAAYNGALMSFLAHPGLQTEPDTVPLLVDAVRKGEYAVGTIRDSAEYAFFRNSNESQIRYLFAAMERHLVTHDEEGLRESLRRKYAYVGGELTVRADAWDPSGFRFSKDAFMQYGYAIAFSPALQGRLHSFDRKLLQLRESGLVFKWIQDMIERNHLQALLQGRPSGGEGAPHVLNADDVQGAFLVVAMGWTAAALACLIERIGPWRHRL